MTERIGHLWRVKPGCAEEYRRRHRRVWPTLEELLRAAGVLSYTIYIQGELVFSHMVVVDYEAMVARVADDPIARQWEERFEDILEYSDADSQTGWPSSAFEVWTLPPDGDRVPGEEGQVGTV
jgi:L-rhamnose mutarotase